MKLSKSKLIQLIKEELNGVLLEQMYNGGKHMSSVELEAAAAKCEEEGGTYDPRMKTCEKVTMKAREPKGEFRAWGGVHRFTPMYTGPGSGGEYGGGHSGESEEGTYDPGPSPQEDLYNFQKKFPKIYAAYAKANIGALCRMVTDGAKTPSPPKRMLTLSPAGKSALTALLTIAYPYKKPGFYFSGAGSALIPEPDPEPNPGVMKWRSRKAKQCLKKLLGAGVGPAGWPRW